MSWAPSPAMTPSWSSPANPTPGNNSRSGSWRWLTSSTEGRAQMTERVVLAYSGGLDTSVAIGWIAEETGAEVVAVAVDVGQGGEDLETIRRRALGCGAE